MMPTIILTVTQPVIDQVAAVDMSQAQIAKSAPSEEIRGALDAATGEQRVILELGGCVQLSVGDTTAIWRSHQPAEYLPDFDSLFELLSRRPGDGMLFECDIP